MRKPVLWLRTLASVAVSSSLPSRLDRPNSLLLNSSMHPRNLLPGLSAPLAMADILPKSREYRVSMRDDSLHLIRLRTNAGVETLNPSLRQGGKPL